MRVRALFAGLMTLAVSGSSLTGCSTEPAGTNLPVTKPATQEEIKQAQDQVKAGMGGMYKGPPTKSGR